MMALWDQTLVFLSDYGVWIAVVSLLMFVLSLAAIPLIVARIPVDYFTRQGRQRLDGKEHHAVLRLLIAGLKNMFGAILIMAGIIMLFTPGQGLLSILFGLMIMNYPGKYRLECWIIGRPLIFHSINAMREKQGKPPLLEPQD